jgi:hypothetical protein
MSASFFASSLVVSSEEEKGMVSALTIDSY